MRGALAGAAAAVQTSARGVMMTEAGAARTGAGAAAAAGVPTGAAGRRRRKAGASLTGRGRKQGSWSGERRDGAGTEIVTEAGAGTAVGTGVKSGIGAGA